MNEHRIARSMLLRIGRGIPASTPLAKAVVEWAQPHVGWVLGAGAAPPDELTWDMLLAGAKQAAANDEPRPHALVLAEELAALLALAPFDAALLTIMIACDRLPRVAALAAVAARVPTLVLNGSLDLQVPASLDLPPIRKAMVNDTDLTVAGAARPQKPPAYAPTRSVP